MGHAKDFSKGKRGRVIPEQEPERGKVKITIRLDEDVVERFLQIAEQSGDSVGYQTLINSALREYLDGKRRELKRRCGELSVKNSNEALPDIA